MNELVSIIVPIYNIEQYLVKCINSIIAQTYTSIEIILVNDGSTDNGLEICESFAKNDCRVKVINKENGGLISAWTLGVENAMGEMLSFVDGDDSIESNMIEIMMKSQSKNDSDLVICDYFTVENNANNYQNGINAEDGFLSGQKLDDLKLKLIPYNDNYDTMLPFFRWNKLFKRKMFNECLNYLNNDVSYFEDLLIVIPYILKAKSIEIIHIPLYYYYMRSSSITHVCNAEKTLKSKMKALDICDKVFLDFNYNLRCDYLRYKNISYEIKYYGSFKSNIKNYKICLDYYKKLTKIKLNFLRKKERFKLFLLRKRCYWLLSLLFLIKEKL